VPLQGAELEAFEAARLLSEAAAAAAAGEEEAAAAEAMLPLRESSGVLSQLKRSNTGAVEQVRVMTQIHVQCLLSSLLVSSSTAAAAVQLGRAWCLCALLNLILCAPAACCRFPAGAA
jgi:hypothetical protein